MNTTSSSRNNKSINKSNLMKAAWETVKRNANISFSDALKAAWKAMKLKAQMLAGVAEFSFRKANGEIRKAIGTLQPDLVNYEVKGTGHARSAACIPFYDMEKHSFRSFNVWTLL